MFGIGCKIYGTSKYIQYTTIYGLLHSLAQIIIKLFRISIAEIIDLLNPKISQIFCNRFTNTWDFL